MGLSELRRRYTKAADDYCEIIAELRWMMANGVSRRKYLAFWRNSVDPAAAAVRSARLALQKELAIRSSANAGCLRQ